MALLLAITTAFLVPFDVGDLGRLAVLVGCALVNIVLIQHIERKREYSRNSKVAYVDTRAAWTFAALIVLPLPLATAMVLISSIAWGRVYPIAGRGLLHRWIFTNSTVLLGSFAAAFVLANGMSSYPGAPASTPLAGLADFGVIAAAALLRWAVNAGMVMAAIALSDPSVRVRELFSSFSDQSLEAGAYALGVAIAVIVLANPFVLPAVVVGVVALHRSSLVDQYRKAARQDTKTGLASAGWWHEFAEQTMARTRDREAKMGVLMVDLDHFKSINDTYGHPFGDDVLRAVAAELRAEIRDDDACGRWGGEEFTVVLRDVGSEANLRRVAERIRLRIESIALTPEGGVPSDEPIHVTASIGAAVYPAQGITTLDDLLLAADSALYEAKNSGRNTVRVSPISRAPVDPERAPVEPEEFREEQPPSTPSSVRPHGEAHEVTYEKGD